MISEGGTEHCHMVTVARGPAPFGPFEPCPRNPILTHRSLHLPIKAVGHADLVQAQNGSWWMVCLGMRPVPYPWVHHLGRETFLAPVQWAADGWPVAGDNGVIQPEMVAEGLKPRLWPETGTRADFHGPEWVHIRNPREGDCTIGERGLVLRGSKVSLDDTGSPACLCRRQEHFNCDAETLLDFHPREDGDQAGLAAYLNERFHYEIAITRPEDTRRVMLRKRVGSLWKVERNEACPQGQVRLRIRADHERYLFAFAPEAGPWTELGQGECRLLSSEVGGKFTGLVFCLYAVAGTATFRWFEYRPHEKQWRLKP
jgi:alpha-N-arabinofuranosidase